MKKNTTGFKNVSAMMAALAGLSSSETLSMRKEILNTPVLRQNKGIKAYTVRTGAASIKRASIKKRNKKR